MVLINLDEEEHQDENEVLDDGKEARRRARGLRKS